MEPVVETKKVRISVQRGPLEGLLLVNGRPEMEAVDMPTISFESIKAIEQIEAYYHRKEKR